jgi:hypothetical protein
MARLKTWGWPGPKSGHLRILCPVLAIAGRRCNLSPGSPPRAGSPWRACHLEMPYPQADMAEEGTLLELAGADDCAVTPSPIRIRWRMRTLPSGKLAKASLLGEGWVRDDTPSLFSASGVLAGCRLGLVPPSLCKFFCFRPLLRTQGHNHEIELEIRLSRRAR